MVKKHKKATKENKGGIITKEAFINLSNLKKLEDTRKAKKWYRDLKKNTKMNSIKMNKSIIPLEYYLRGKKRFSDL